MRAIRFTVMAVSLLAVCGQALAIDRNHQNVQQSPAEDLSRQCEKDDFQACITLGMMHEASVAPDASLGIAVEMYQKACIGQHMTGCTALAMLHEESGQVGRARDLYREACNKGEMYACSRLGTLIHPQDADQAFRLWNEVCENDEPLGCRLLREHEGQHIN